ncbi:Cation-transporting P-type ATPase A [Corynebacterium kutscheri]|uniref:Cation transport ATPase n=1 Tax=Corynebacterium kutscheri TaxID=35755 RepID=A0A0F6QYC5_9CORY|nr:HAD family hydrolase [Corynebacterium kutscheri]AKE40487.1 cation transport ATPase [Corynebacterium kutscheri]VEH05105.1 Cation-transporting P-type ATPase A [Corynebacterium kutscheri]VEH10882.1 Cation-transporting P-type ATPase A [Corynebacterium kutscheri]VEH80641.1 Cation-transporting P-type ATPase A [Corynebacterium kutscheri]
MVDVPSQKSSHSLDTDLESSIRAAKVAAEKAGVNTSTMHAIDPDEAFVGALHSGRTSFSFELENLPSASSIAEVEAEINAIAGIDVRIVYASATAWVTALRTVDPMAIVNAFANFGITATLTDSSLRRRIAWADVEDRRYQQSHRRYRRRNYISQMSSQLRRQAEEEEKKLESARTSGFFKENTYAKKSQEEPSDVLFTARALLTKKRLIVSIILTIPVMLIGYFPDFQFNYWQYVLLALSAPVVFYGAWPFHRAMIGGARRAKSALDAASSVAILGAWLWSAAMILFTSVGDLHHRANPQWTSLDPTKLEDGALFFDVACGMTVFLLIGRIFIRKTRPSYFEWIHQFKTAYSSEVLVVVKNRKTGKINKELLPLQKLKPGDDIIVEPRQTIPVDGYVIGGSAIIDARAIGLEPMMVKVNDSVYAGCVNGDKPLKIRVQHTGYRTWLAAIYRWVMNASVNQNKADMIAIQSASVLVPISFVIAASSFAMWALLTNNLNQAFATSLATLGCVAPVAVALCSSLPSRLGIEAMARRGVLIRNSQTIHELDVVDTVIMNRWGSLSDSEMNVETVTAERGENPELVVRVAAALSLESEHPVARALIRAARESRDALHDDSIPSWIEASQITLDHDGNFHALVELPLKDSTGEAEMRTVEAVLWRPKDLSSLEGRLAAAAVSGGTPLVVTWKGKDRGVITLHDSPKDDATTAVDAMEALGLETVMLSRDTYPVARRYGDSMGVSHVLAGIQPRQKPQTVRSVRSHGAKVAMVGDSSVNECFRVANVGILLGALRSIKDTSELEHPAADIVMLDSKVMSIAQIFRFSYRLNRLIRNSLILVWAYNVVAILAAVSGILHPMLATILMLGFSLIIEFRSGRAANLQSSYN